MMTGKRTEDHIAKVFELAEHLVLLLLLLHLDLLRQASFRCRDLRAEESLPFRCLFECRPICETRAGLSSRP